MIKKIYALIDPTTKVVRYIGASANPRLRLNNHVCNAGAVRYKGTKRAAWLLRLASRGLRPQLKVLEVCTDRSWQIAEREWITKHRRHLFNIDNGGGGSGTLSKATRRKRAKIQTALWKSSVVRKCIVRGVRAAWNDPGKRRQRSLRISIAKKKFWKSDPSRITALIAQNKRVHTGARRSKEARANMRAARLNWLAKNKRSLA